MYYLSAVLQNFWSEMGFSEFLGTSVSSSQENSVMETCTELEANELLFADLENQLRDHLSKLEVRA